MKPQFVPFLLILLLAAQSLTADWKPVPGHIMTRWAREVNPRNVLPEYPRPQLRREGWTNLNGLWELEIARL